MRNTVNAKTLAASGLAHCRQCSQAVAAQSDVVISIITEDHGVRRIFTGSQGFLERGRAYRQVVHRDAEDIIAADDRSARACTAGSKPAAVSTDRVARTGQWAIPQARTVKLFALVGGREKTWMRAPAAGKMIAPNCLRWASMEVVTRMKLAVNLGVRCLHSGKVGIARAWRQARALTIDQMLDVLQEAPTRATRSKAKSA